MALHDGDRGVILQRDGRTYAIVPHLPCGMVSPEMLRNIAAVADQFGAVLKCTSAQRIAIIGLRAEDVDAAWAELGGCNPGRATGAVVRSVRSCPGIQFCKRARQDSLGLGLELDRLYNGRPMPGTIKIGVSGCGNQCAETAIKDIGLIGGARGWMIVVGGNCGTTPRLAKELLDSEVSTEQALQIVEKLLDCYSREAHSGERMGDFVARVGMQTVRRAVGVPV